MDQERACNILTESNFSHIIDNAYA